MTDARSCCQQSQAGAEGSDGSGAAPALLLDVARFKVKGRAGFEAGKLAAAHFHPSHVSAFGVCRAVGLSADCAEPAFGLWYHHT